MMKSEKRLTVGSIQRIPMKPQKTRKTVAAKVKFIMIKPEASSITSLVKRTIREGECPVLQCIFANAILSAS